jgi:hypothetical protein
MLVALSQEHRHAKPHPYSPLTLSSHCSLLTLLSSHCSRITLLSHHTALSSHCSLTTPRCLHSGTKNVNHQVRWFVRRELPTLSTSSYWVTSTSFLIAHYAIRTVVETHTPPLQSLLLLYPSDSSTTRQVYNKPAIAVPPLQVLLL